MCNSYSCEHQNHEVHFHGPAAQVEKLLDQATCIVTAQNLCIRLKVANPINFMYMLIIGEIPHKFIGII